MRFTPHPFKSDVVEFTWLDLLRMMFGKELQHKALIARKQGKPE